MFLSLLSLFISSHSAGLPSGKGVPENDPLTAVLDHHYNLEYDSARQQLDAWLATHPADLRAWNYLATVLLHREMFHRGVLESQIQGELGEPFAAGKVPYSPGFQKEFFGVLEKAQALAENRLKQNTNDQDALYWLGSTHATRAVFYYTMARSYLAALRESLEARKDHAQLLKLNPKFVDAWLVVGINDFIAGSLPWYLKVFASVTGFRGNRAQGLEEVKRVSEQGQRAREDAKFILTILYRRQKMYGQMLGVLQDLAQTYPRNFLVKREIGEIYEIQGNLQAAAKNYDSLISEFYVRRFDATEFPAAKILYEGGRVYSRLGDVDRALSYFERAGKLPGNDIFVYRADLAAGDLYSRQNRRTDARRKFKRVAAAVPNTDEGKQARRALKKIHDDNGLPSGGSDE